MLAVNLAPVRMFDMSRADSISRVERFRMHDHRFHFSTESHILRPRPKNTEFQPQGMFGDALKSN